MHLQNRTPTSSCPAEKVSICQEARFEMRNSSSYKTQNSIGEGVMKPSSQVMMRVLSQFGPLVSASPAASSHSFCCSAHDAGERKEDYAANDATDGGGRFGWGGEGREGDERGINQSHLQQFVREAGKVVAVIKCSLRCVDSSSKGCGNLRTSHMQGQPSAALHFYVLHFLTNMLS